MLFLPVLEKRRFRYERATCVDGEGYGVILKLKGLVEGNRAELCVCV